nr:uncharacterized protein LOC106690086 [Halyomorpha halys]
MLALKFQFRLSLSSLNLQQLLEWHILASIASRLDYEAVAWWPSETLLILDSIELLFSMNLLLHRVLRRSLVNMSTKLLYTVEDLSPKMTILHPPSLWNQVKVEASSVLYVALSLRRGRARASGSTRR